jgi:hypothetical protein
MPSFNVWLNPLKCPEIEYPGADTTTIPAERLLDYLFAPSSERGRDAFVARYREIMAAVPDPFAVAPNEPNILNKLVWPLRHAKGSYALANYLGCIALCGMVGEMAAILLWDISKVRLSGREMNPSEERALLGSTFERLGQERRAQVLQVFGFINADTKVAFDSLREIRRKYLHLFSHSHEQVAADAQKAFHDAAEAVKVVLGQSFEDGKFIAPRVGELPNRTGDDER